MTTERWSFLLTNLVLPARIWASGCLALSASASFSVVGLYLRGRVVGGWDETHFRAGYGLWGGGSNESMVSPTKWVARGGWLMR